MRGVGLVASSRLVERLVAALDEPLYNNMRHAIRTWTSRTPRMVLNGLGCPEICFGHRPPRRVHGVRREPSRVVVVPLEVVGGSLGGVLVGIFDGNFCDLKHRADGFLGQPSTTAMGLGRCGQDLSGQVGWHTVWWILTAS